MKKVLLSVILMLVFFCCCLAVEAKEVIPTWDTSAQAVFDYYNLQNKGRIKHLIEDIIGIKWDETQWGPPNLKQLRGMDVDQQKCDILLLALIDEMYLDTEEINANVKGVKEDIAVIKEGVSDIRGKTAAFKAALDILLAEISTKNARIAELETKIKLLEEAPKPKAIDSAELDLCKKELADLKERVNKLVEKYKDLIDELAKKDRTIKSLSADRDKWGENSKKWQGKYNRLLVKYRALKNDPRLYLMVGAVGFVGASQFDIAKWLKDEDNCLKYQLGGEIGIGTLIEKRVFVQGFIGLSGDEKKLHAGAEAGLNIKRFKIGGGVLYFQDKVNPSIYCSSSNWLNTFVRINPSKKARFIQIGAHLRINITDIVKIND